MQTSEPLAFISYRRIDSSAASRWLANIFSRTFGAQSVFIDTESIRMSDDWAERINQALRSSTLLIPVIGPGWLSASDQYRRRRIDNPDDWVFNEIRHALESKVRILPVLLSRTPQEYPHHRALHPRRLRTDPADGGSAQPSFGLKAADIPRDIASFFPPSPSDVVNGFGGKRAVPICMDRGSGIHSRSFGPESS